MRGRVEPSVWELAPALGPGGVVARGVDCRCRDRRAAERPRPTLAARDADLDRDRPEALPSG